MKVRALAILTLMTLSFQISNAQNFPSTPVHQMTPGKLCDQPDSYRYAEQIPYCDRNVSQFTKIHIIEEYDQQFGFNIEDMPRSQFKIDHYIPLCAGGSNDESNLWPQHVSVYMITDALEKSVCDNMEQGKLLQHDAVDLIIKGKNNLNEVPEILHYLHSL